MTEASTGIDQTDTETEQQREREAAIDIYRLAEGRR